MLRRSLAWLSSLNLMTKSELITVAVEIAIVLVVAFLLGSCATPKRCGRLNGQTYCEDGYNHWSKQ